jgi:uncharacterized protein
MRDRGEGVAPDGTVVTGVARERVPAAYEPVIADAVERLRGRLGDDLHSVYLYGSVATGQACPPGSDVDLLAVTRSGQVDLTSLASDLGDRYAYLAREVGIAHAAVSVYERDDVVGHGERCFLKHYAVCVAGDDLRDALPTCRATSGLAFGFNGDVGHVLARYGERLRIEPDPTGRADAATKACRKILMAAATLLSTREGGWSTDRVTGADLIARHAPEHADLAAAALARSVAGEVDDTTFAIIDRLGGWLAEEYALSPGAGHGNEAVG